MNDFYAPYSSQIINEQQGYFRPSEVQTYNDATTALFERYLYFRLMSIYKITMPEWWDDEFVYYTLITNGYMAVLDTEKYGIIPQACTIGGYNIYWNPNRFSVVTPSDSLIVQNAEIGVDGEMLRLTPDWLGLRDMIHYFAEKQALNSAAIDMNLLNSKVAFILAGKNKSAAQALKKIFDKIMKGSPAVAADNTILRDSAGNESIYAFNRDVKASFILPELLESFRELDRIFDEYMGIPNVGTEKKERLTNEEVNANNGKTRSLAETMLKMLQKSIRDIIKLYPELSGKLSAEYAFKNERGEVDGTGNNDPAGAE